MPFLICAAIMIFFFALIFRNSVDIPNGDDLFCLMLFTQQFEDASGFTERFGLLMEQWIEHRIVYSRFTALLSYWIHGQLNFVTIILIGNFTLVGLTILFWKILKKIGVSMYYLIPVALTLFSPVMYEGNVWAGASTVYMPVCFFGLLSMYFLAMPWRAAFLLAIITALLATFSFGNGMFCFPAGFLMLLICKKYKNSIIWLSFGCLAIALYFVSYKTDRSAYALGFASHFRYPAYILYNFLAFGAGILDYTENVFSPLQLENLPTMLLGILLTAIVLSGIGFLLRRRAKDGKETVDNGLKMAWLGMVLFIGITSLAMAYSRTTAEQINTLTSRYKIYSMVTFILAYLWCLIYYKKKFMIGYLFGGFSLCLLLLNYFTYYHKLTNYKSTLLAGVYNYNNNHKWVIYQNTSYFERVGLVLSDSIRRNPNPVYTFPDVFEELNYRTLSNAKTLDDVWVSDSYNGNFGKFLSVKSDKYPCIKNVFDGIYLVVYSSKNIFLFPTDPARNGRMNMICTGQYFKDGFVLNTNFNDVLLKEEEYRMAIFCPTEIEKIRLLNYKIQGPDGQLQREWLVYEDKH